MRVLRLMCGEAEGMGRGMVRATYGHPPLSDRRGGRVSGAIATARQSVRRDTYALRERAGIPIDSL